MSKLLGAVAAFVVLSTGLGFAQGPGGPPKPSPEQKRLGYFVGTWHNDGEIKPNGFMPAGKMTGDSTCTWFEGGFAVVCNSTGMSPMGPTKEIGILGYSSEEKVYTYAGVDNSPMSMTSVPKGTVEGGKWTYTDESKMGGKMVKSRYLINETSPTSYTFRMEMLDDKGAWQTIMDGTSTKK